MSRSNSPSITHTLKPSKPPEYKEHLNLYMKEYRQQHKASFVDAQKRYREAHKNDEHLRKKRCEYSKKYYCKIKDTRPPKTEEQKAREKEYHKNYYEKIKRERALECRDV
jgi:hypothetical protein